MRNRLYLVLLLAVSTSACDSTEDKIGKTTNNDWMFASLEENSQAEPPQEDLSADISGQLPTAECGLARNPNPEDFSEVYVDRNGETQKVQCPRVVRDNRLRCAGITPEEYEAMPLEEELLYRGVIMRKTTEEETERAQSKGAPKGFSLEQFDRGYDAAQAQEKACKGYTSEYGY